MRASIFLLTLFLLFISSFSQAQIIADPGFEGGTPNVSWAETSTNFGTPLCDLPGCGNGGGNPPHSGNWWVWFGGTTNAETGSVAQSITIPVLYASQKTTAHFYISAPRCNGSPADHVLELRINGVAQWTFDQSSPLCNQSSWTQISVDLSVFNGQTVDFSFYANKVNGQLSNFFIDDISFTLTNTAPTSVPMLSGWLIAVLALLLVGVVFMRKKLILR